MSATVVENVVKRKRSRSTSSKILVTNPENPEVKNLNEVPVAMVASLDKIFFRHDLHFVVAFVDVQD